MAADALIDFASLDSEAAAVETPVVDSTVVDEPAVDDSTAETSLDDSTTEDAKETETTNADGTEKTAEQVEAFKTKAAAAKSKAESDKAIDTKATPDTVRKALKGLRDSSPANADVVKQLHGSYERWNATKEIFPKGISEMKEAKSFIEAVGGPEGFTKMQEAADAVAGSDELLYAADPQLSKNVYEDMKAQGKESNYGSVVGNFLGHLKGVDSQEYYKQFTPHFYEGVKDSTLPEKMNILAAALEQKNDKGEPTPNLATAGQVIKMFKEWYANLEKDSKPIANEDTPERKKFLEEKTAFEKTKAEDATRRKSEFENGVAEECEHNNNRVLGKSLTPFLKMAFFKDFPRETKIDLGNGIKSRFYAALKADKVYQSQMDSMWKMKAPDRAKMVAYHNAKLASISDEIVRSTIQNRYPGYARGGSAQGKVAAAAAKKVSDTKAAATSVATNKPLYVAARPTNLVRDPFKLGDREISSSDLITLQIAGKGYVRTTDGKGYRYITWRR